MKIISIKWRNGSSDFVHIIVNDDTSRANFAKLKRADINGLFDFAEFSPDTFDSALDYVKYENSPKGVKA